MPDQPKIQDIITECLEFACRHLLAQYPNRLVLELQDQKIIQSEHGDIHSERKSFELRNQMTFRSPHMNAKVERKPKIKQNKLLPQLPAPAIKQDIEINIQTQNIELKASNNPRLETIAPLQANNPTMVKQTEKFSQRLQESIIQIFSLEAVPSPKPLAKRTIKETTIHPLAKGKPYKGFPRPEEQQHNIFTAIQPVEDYDSSIDEHQHQNKPFIQLPAKKIKRQSSQIFPKVTLSQPSQALHENQAQQFSSGARENLQPFIRAFGTPASKIFTAKSQLYKIETKVLSPSPEAFQSPQPQQSSPDCLSYAPLPQFQFQANHGPYNTKPGKIMRQVKPNVITVRPQAADPKKTYANRRPIFIQSRNRAFDEEDFTEEQIKMLIAALQNKYKLTMVKNYIQKNRQNPGRRQLTARQLMQWS